jgi:hypothetical protein
MTPEQMAAERELYRERMRKRAAAEVPHDKRPAMDQHYGGRKKYEHDYLPPDDLNSSHRRVR